LYASKRALIRALGKSGGYSSYLRKQEEAGELRCVEVDGRFGIQIRDPIRRENAVKALAAGRRR
jgi:hypothetical protein